MSTNAANIRSITSVFKQMNKQKKTYMNPNQIKYIQTILINPKHKKFLYQILALYNYTALFEDRNAFLTFDNIIYSRNYSSQNFFTKLPPLKFAFMRLHCLLKYQQPYESWIPVVRQVLHQSTSLSTHDIRTMISLSFFNFIKTNQKLIDLYQQYLTYFQEQIDKIDIISLLMLRKYFSNSKLTNELSQKIKNKIETIITENIRYFTVKQLYLLMNCQVVTHNWLFMFILNMNIACSQPGFMVDLINRPSPWRLWALDKFGKKQTFNRIPKRVQVPPSSVISNLLSRIRVTMPFCDTFFNIEQIQIKDSNRKRSRLVNPQKDMVVYIQNAYKIFAYAGVYFSRQEVQRVNDILEDIFEGNFTKIPEVFVYMSLKSSLTYYLYSEDKNLKKKNEMEMIKNASTLIEKIINLSSNQSEQIGNIKKINQTNQKLPATRILRPLAILEPQCMKTQEFKSIIDQFSAISQDTFNIIKMNNLSGQINELMKVIQNYILGRKSERPLILSGQFKKMYPKSSNNQIMNNFGEYQFSYSSNIEFDRIINVDFLIKIKHLKTQKQIKIFADLGIQMWKDNQAELRKTLNLQNRQNQRITNKTIITKYWKKKYISQWYDFNYEALEHKTIQEFVLSGEYQKYFQLVD